MVHVWGWLAPKGLIGQEGLNNVKARTPRKSKRCASLATRRALGTGTGFTQPRQDAPGCCSSGSYVGGGRTSTPTESIVNMLLMVSTAQLAMNGMVNFIVGDEMTCILR